MEHFFAYLARLKHIRRWGLMRNTQTENNLEHSMLCAYFAHGLAVIGNQIYGKQYDVGAVMVAAAYHDAAEVITGDLATPIKYFNPRIKEAYQELDGIAKEKLLDMLPKELSQEYEQIFSSTADPTIGLLVKAADRLCAYIKCLEEERAGNREFQKAKENICCALEKIHLPELDYFMEHFLESFTLTLDELN